jgi:hypothetical protein
MYIEHRIGEEMSGVITGVKHFGLFIMLDEVYVDGLLHVSNLHNDYYQVAEGGLALVGEHSGRQFRLGDKVRVKVLRVDIDEAQVDFALVSGGTGRGGWSRSLRAPPGAAAIAASGDERYAANRGSSSASMRSGSCSSACRRQVERLLLQADIGQARLARLADLLQSPPFPVERRPAPELHRLAEGGRHQGVVALVRVAGQLDDARRARADRAAGRPGAAAAARRRAGPAQPGGLPAYGQCCGCRPRARRAQPHSGPDASGQQGRGRCGRGAAPGAGGEPGPQHGLAGARQVSS